MYHFLSLEFNLYLLNILLLRYLFRPDYFLAFLVSLLLFLFFYHLNQIFVFMDIWQFNLILLILFFLSQLWSRHLWWLYLALTCYFPLIYLLTFNILLGFMVRMLKTWDPRTFILFIIGLKSTSFNSHNFINFSPRKYTLHILLHGTLTSFLFDSQIQFLYFRNLWLFIFLIFFFIYLSYFNFVKIR